MFMMLRLMWQLRPRLKEEAARRGQPVPTVRLEMEVLPESPLEKGP
jgi:hypothetical protein